MAQIEVKMPKMGESITEATIIQWSKKVGDSVAYEETLLEIATDKVDSEIPSPVEGVLSKILFEADAVVAVGSVIALISTEAVGESPAKPTAAATIAPPVEEKVNGTLAHTAVLANASVEKAARPSNSKRFYTPLVRSIATAENIDIQTLDQIPGTGNNNRVTKKDILAFVANKGTTNAIATDTVVSQPVQATSSTSTKPSTQSVGQSINGEVEIIEMDRTRRLIAEHMVRSKQTSAHVTSFIEADVTNLVNWRNSVKAAFKEKHQENITFTPIFIEAVVKAIQDFPLINVSVEGNNILLKKAINVGMATALPSGNLIVPVIKNADQLSLLGLTKGVNTLAQKARANQLKPQDIQGGTFTLTNVGTFGNVMGTPIINQPQVAILSVGAIRKKPAVLETEYGDVIAIRQMMFLSLSYDHRVVDGMLGGSFLRRVGDYLEQFDVNRKV